MSSSLTTSVTELPAASFAFAWRSMRTICSRVCLFFIESPSPSAHLGHSDSHSSWISFWGAGQTHKRSRPLPDLSLDIRRKVTECLSILQSYCLKASERAERPPGFSDEP